MALINRPINLNRRGTVFILAMIFLVIFSALAISMATISGTNVQIASNQFKSDRARACAESGFYVIRYWLNRVSISGTTSEEQRFNQIAASLQNELTTDSITNITMSCSSSVINIPTVTLDSENASSFSAVITPVDSNTLQIDVTGISGSIFKTIRANYYFGKRGHNVFDYGVATKGPLSLSGNIELDGVNVSVEASVYIESYSSNLALSIIGNSQIAGDVSIVNPIASVDLQGGKAGIGGETGQAAIDNHVDFGVPQCEFPEPMPALFESYITSVIDSDTDTSSDATFENVRIIADTNPNFSGQVTLRGIVYIETPNVVDFTGGVDITGIIVGDGSRYDNSGTNKIIFRGNVQSHPITELPTESQFNGLHDQTGTFVIAPGFNVSFGGSFSTLSGAIAGNGIEFFGNAGGTINGSIINYSGEEMSLSGNSDLYFNRSGTTNSPAGFVPEIVLEYNPSSYLEVI
ncbi:MAG: pilus assembly PilX N-terminal domain-containing protein [Sedimentisphaerales bacterium]|nr:pilus assembly PilX N-terminal domain-containing protein [Sedimentisphaerales bacterium]